MVITSFCRGKAEYIVAERFGHGLRWEVMCIFHELNAARISFKKPNVYEVVMITCV